MQTIKKLFILTILIFATAFLTTGCKSRKGIGPGGVGVNTLPGQVTIFTQAQLDRDLHSVFLAEERLYDDNVVFEYYGHWVADIYCCTHEELQFDSLENYIEKSSVVLKNYGSIFQLATLEHTTPVTTSLPPHYIRTIEQKRSAADGALSDLEDHGHSHGKMKSPRQKPGRPDEPDVETQDVTNRQ